MVVSEDERGLLGFGIYLSQKPRRRRARRMPADPKLFAGTFAAGTPERPASGSISAAAGFLLDLAYPAIRFAQNDSGS